MHTEILPLIVSAIKFIVGGIGAIAALTAILAAIEYRIAETPKKRKEMKDVVVNGLIAVVLLLIAYMIISIIGPVFNILFNA